MKDLRKRYNRFCYTHRNAGIPNLMLWIILLNVAAYVVFMADPSYTLLSLMVFRRDAILHGEVWRIFSPLALGFVGSNPVIVALLAFCYYTIGKTLEQFWGTLRFNLYYLTGYLALLLAGFLFNMSITGATLNISLFLAYATLFPDTQFLIFMIIPVKARWLGILDLGYMLLQLCNIWTFPYNLMPLFIIANYLLHFGKDVANIFPVSWQINANKVRRNFKKSMPGKSGPAKTVPFRPAAPMGYKATTVPYNHKCTVCGRTDVDDPQLEFRYCSRCSGYHCYCSDHINNHAHITE